MSDSLIPLFDVRLRDEDVQAVEQTLRSGWLTMGPQTKAFEEAFAEHLGVRHAVALANCTAALHLAYLAAGVGPGDEVIVPAITFVATANAVRYCGATPVLADVVGQGDLGIDPEGVEALITSRTKAVCAVHYAGYPAAIEQLERICAEHGLALIEDAAHSPSASTASGRKLGAIGLAGCFSFFSNKVLSCGEGGLLATDDDAVAERARSLRSHAMTTGTWDRHRGHSLGYDVVDTGFNYRMDEPRAALLISRLSGLQDDVAKRRALCHRYRRELGDVPGLTLPYGDAEVDLSSCYVMPLMLEDPELQTPLRELMKERWNVQTSLLYPAIHEFTAYLDSQDHALPRSERAARTQVTVPLYPDLTQTDQDRVIAAVREGLAELSSDRAALRKAV
jgi:dTDP-4-amino-4,6-dideoxygalactose transaminase